MRAGEDDKQLASDSLFCCENKLAVYLTVYCQYPAPYSRKQRESTSISSSRIAALTSTSSAHTLRLARWHRGPR